jgi:L-alanine-DL-glutamate epimerase-like enolase superfamily enzyme
MTVTAVETIINPEHPILLWVRVYDDSGLVGLGETTGQPAAVERLIHDMFAPLLFGQDPTRIDWFWHRAYRALAYHGSGGAELRALSALDIALWDLLGKRSQLPLYTLLGGASRDRIPIYNTCGDYGEVRDRVGFLTRPGELARELVNDGIAAVKIWPFDEFAKNTGGHRISRHDLACGVARVQAMREAVGDGLEIAIEGHCLWSLPAAIQIAKALAQLQPMWLEDMIWPENGDALAALRTSTEIPLVASERLLTRWGAREALRAGGADIVMFDLAWTGGISEARRVAEMASIDRLPVAPHNCGGAVLHVANAHLCAAIPNLFLMETVRAFYRGFFDDLITSTPTATGGYLALPGGPGLGVELREDMLADPAVRSTRSTSGDGTAAGWAIGDPWVTTQF